MLSGRVARKPDLTPQYLMLGTVPDDDLVDRLQPMIRTGDRGLGVVAVGKLPGTRWHLTVDESGHLVLPLLDSPCPPYGSPSARPPSSPASSPKAREQRSPATDGSVAHPARAAARVTTRTGRRRRCGSACSARTR